MHPLNKEQLRAAGSRQIRTFIEAGPGSGKTTIAAERFGLLRFTRSTASDPPIVAVSFTAAATSVLRRTIRGRWGHAALGQRGTVRTIDNDLVATLHFLLRAGHIAWPGGHTTLEPIDSWAGTPDLQYRHPDVRWREFYGTALVDREVTAIKMKDKSVDYVFGKKVRLALFAKGDCTHDDVRAVLGCAFADPELRSLIVEHLRATRMHLIVDEVFDANEVDLEFIELHCEAGIPVTLVGDFWQALYEFRHATPVGVREKIANLDFATFPVGYSYRFESAEMKAVAESARGNPVALRTAGSNVKVVLAQYWSQLWDGPAWVLPTSHGAVYNKTDALLALLVDHLVHRHLRIEGRGRADAFRLLRIDAEEATRWPDVFGEIEAVLDTSQAGATAALGRLRESVSDIGGQGKVPVLNKEENEAEAVALMQHIARRVEHGGPFVEGISVHQAKGGEWESVGICMDSTQASVLSRGLNPNKHDHRVLYVALTRASESVGRVV
jgi:DNA helicase-2/ATP-dependent DNA helicase PcrA